MLYIIFFDWFIYLYFLAFLIIVDGKDVVIEAKIGIKFIKTQIPTTDRVSQARIIFLASL